MAVLQIISHSHIARRDRMQSFKCCMKWQKTLVACHSLIFNQHHFTGRLTRSKNSIVTHLYLRQEQIYKQTLHIQDHLTYCLFLHIYTPVSQRKCTQEEWLQLKCITPPSCDIIYIIHFQKSMYPSFLWEVGVSIMPHLNMEKHFGALY